MAKLVRRKDKNVKSVSAKTEDLVDISDCADYIDFKFPEPEKANKKKKIDKNEKEKEDETEEEKDEDNENENDLENPFKEVSDYKPKAIDASI